MEKRKSCSLSLTFLVTRLNSSNALASWLRRSKQQEPLGEGVYAKNATATLNETRDPEKEKSMDKFPDYWGAKWVATGWV